MPVNCGEVFRVKNSIVNPANGSWSIYAIKYNLETWKENGKWEMVLYGTRIIENG